MLRQRVPTAHQPFDQPCERRPRRIGGMYRCRVSFLPFHRTCLQAGTGCSIEEGAHSFAISIGTCDPDVFQLLVGHFQQCQAAAAAFQCLAKPACGRSHHHRHATAETREARRLLSMDDRRRLSPGNCLYCTRHSSTIVTIAATTAVQCICIDSEIDTIY